MKTKHVLNDAEVTQAMHDFLKERETLPKGVDLKSFIVNASGT